MCEVCADVFTCVAGKQEEEEGEDDDGDETEEVEQEEVITQSTSIQHVLTEEAKNTSDMLWLYMHIFGSIGKHR